MEQSITDTKVKNGVQFPVGQGIVAVINKLIISQRCRSHLNGFVRSAYSLPSLNEVQKRTEKF